jgi:hypothetical protein
MIITINNESEEEREAEMSPESKHE